MQRVFQIDEPDYITMMLNNDPTWIEKGDQFVVEMTALAREMCGILYDADEDERPLEEQAEDFPLQFVVKQHIKPQDPIQEKLYHLALSNLFYKLFAKVFLQVIGERDGKTLQPEKVPEAMMWAGITCRAAIKISFTRDKEPAQEVES